MKRAIVGGCLGVMLAHFLVAQPATFYVNDGIVQCPPQTIPQIDALNFVNNNFFSVNPPVPSPRPYYTTHTLNFTNRGIMDGNLGFDFSTYTPEAPPQGQFRWASAVHNIGTISAGVSTNISPVGFGLGKVLIAATNIYSPGSVWVGQDCFVRVYGSDVNLSRGILNMEGFTDLSPNGNLLGLFSGYWGIGTNRMPTFAMPVPVTPAHEVTNRYNQVFNQVLALNGALAYGLEEYDPGQSNSLIRAVFLRNTNAAMTMRVYFPSRFDFFQEPNIIVEWAWTRTNLFSTVRTNDYLYLVDTLGERENYGLVFTDTSGPRFTYRPSNFTFLRGGPRDYGAPADVNQALVLPSGGRTNDSAAYQALFVPTTVIPSDTAGANATNLPGRILIWGDARLNMEYMRLAGPNTLDLTSSNHFVGSRGAQIAVPLAQITLRNTNGWLAITNLLAPAIPRPEGPVDLYSCRWTNVVNNITNTYHVLFVDSELAPTSYPRIQDLNLSATNLLISDVLNITRYFIFDGTAVTLTANEPTAPTPAGGINILSPSIIWSTATPRLSYLTNYGSIITMNAVYFGGSRYAPFYSTNFNEPYEVFINRGTVTNEGTLIWAKHFDNSGIFHSSSGSLTLESGPAVLTNGLFSVPSGDLNLSASSLLVSNHNFVVGRALTLAVTNALDDGGVTNGNTWVVGGGGWSVPGVNLLVKPPVGDLLGTTVSNLAAPYANSLCQWAAADRGCGNEGYANNVALGRLILNGGYNSLFTFTGTGSANALYVDYLELKNYATNRDGGGNFSALSVDSNMKIYFAQAVMNGVSIAEKLDGRNGGRFCWVSSYAGHFSGTNVVYPSGMTNYLNAALVQSCNLDSDGDGTVNCADPTPVFTPDMLALRVVVTNQPSFRALLSWQTTPYSTNYLYYKTNLAAANWQLLTNFAVGASGGRVTVSDPVSGSGPRFYRARVGRY